jgi:predicted outer membrane repeat protein
MLSRTHAITFLVAAAFASFPALATTYVVKPDGTGDYPTIQAAIDAAVDGDTIELTDGTFTGEGNRDIDYLGKVITVESQSGTPGDCIIDCEGSGRGFHFHSGEDPAARLADVTVKNGHAEVGGRLYCHESSPTISGCLLLQNHAEIGSGILCYESSPVISGCILLQNQASNWGGGYCGYYSSPTIENCAFQDNSSPTDVGGGMFCAGPSSPTMVGCVFSGNSADYKGGAIALHDGCAGTFLNCTFISNSAQYGGGIFCSWNSHSAIANCTFYGNSAEGGSGLYCFYDSDAVVEQSIFAFSIEGNAVQLQDASAALACCDIYGNAGGDWVGGIEDQHGVNGNISEDPLFCDPENGDLTLHVHSPCAPFSPPNEECGLIGAWPVACGGPTVVESTTWGRIKAAYR